MKISRSSWHFKLANQLFYAAEKDNLCKYFWTVVLSVLVGWIAIPIKYVMDCLGDPDDTLVGVLMGGIYLGFFMLIAILFFTGSVEWGFIIFGIVIAFFAIPIGIIRGILFVVDRYDRRTDFGRKSLWHPNIESKKYKDRGPNILMEYLRAKKGRYCPRIEFTRDD